jgi:hypothetical protein
VLSGSYTVELAGIVVFTGGHSAVVFALPGNLVVELTGHGIVVLDEGHGILVVFVTNAVAVMIPSELVSALWPDVMLEVVAPTLTEVCGGVGTGTCVKPVPLNVLEIVAFGMGKVTGTKLDGLGISVTGGNVMVVLSKVMGGNGAGTGTSVLAGWSVVTLGERLVPGVEKDEDPVVANVPEAGNPDEMPVPGRTEEVELGCGNGGIESTGGTGRLGKGGDDGKTPVPVSVHDCVPGEPGVSESVALGNGGMVRGRVDA